MIPDSERAFARDIEIVIDDHSDGPTRISQIGNVEEMTKENGSNSTNVDGDGLFGAVLAVGELPSKEGIDNSDLETNGIAVKSIASISSISQANEVSERVDVSTSANSVSSEPNFSKFRSVSVAVGQSNQDDNDQASILSRKRQRSGSSRLYDSALDITAASSRQHRPIFPPYGSDQEGNGVRFCTRATQTESWEFPKPRKRKKSACGSKLNRFQGLNGSVSKQQIVAGIDSTFPKVQIFPASKIMQSNGSQNGLAVSTVAPYKPPTLLPQRTMLCADRASLDHYQPSGSKRAKSQATKNVEKVEQPRNSRVSKPKKSTITSQSSILEENNGFPCRLRLSAPVSYVSKPFPTLDLSRPLVPAECARHKRFDGWRRARNWFSFISHPKRSDWLGHRSNGQIKAEEIPKDKKRVAAIKAWSVSAQYEWLRRNPVSIRLGKSKIHGVGVFAKEDIPVGQFITEYKGEVIRNSLVERRESSYRTKGLGSYMFQIDLKFTVDGTMKGGIARFVNHSCDPNCSAKIIKCDDKKKHIILIAAKKISKGDELSYDYKMPKEREKVPCLCGSPICRKFLN